MKTIHLSQQRFDFLLTQGYSIERAESANDGEKFVLHLLSAEHAECTTCNAEFTSVDACSPAEMETIKTCLEFYRDPAEFLRDGRQHMADFVRRTVIGQAKIDVAQGVAAKHAGRKGR